MANYIYETSKSKNPFTNHTDDFQINRDQHSDTYTIWFREQYWGSIAFSGRTFTKVLLDNVDLMRHWHKQSNDKTKGIVWT
jgi:hypothetical protein